MPEALGVELYRSASGDIELAVHTDGESVWLSRSQLATLFGRDVKTIGKHVANARSEELVGLAVVAKFATTAADGKTYQVEHYNLDMVLSVGYRVKSAEGVHFRRWANDVLKRYVLQGVALNERRLEQLGTIVQVLSRSSDELVSGVAEVVANYLPSLRALRAYDEGEIAPAAGDAPSWTLTYEEARRGLVRALPRPQRLARRRSWRSAHLQQRTRGDHAHGRDERPEGEGAHDRPARQHARSGRILSRPRLSS